MKFYKITDPSRNEKAQYRCTRQDAHDIAKDFAEDSYDKLEIRIEQVEISTDQETLSQILSGFSPGEIILKTWKLSPRGGMVECPNGE